MLRRASRVGLINQVRSLHTEFGIVMPPGRFNFRHNIGVALEDARLPTLARQILHEVNQRIWVLDEDIPGLRSTHRGDGAYQWAHAAHRGGVRCRTDHR